MQSSALTIESLLEQDSELSSLPEIYIRVCDLLENENSTSGQIGYLVETDPALSLRILKMVNSAFYGFPQQIDNIAQAITILGRQRLKQVLIGSVLGGMFAKISIPYFDMDAFWRHSVQTAVLARYLCLQSEQPQRADSLFTAGLLHDVGRLILAQKLPEQLRVIEKSLADDKEDIYHTELKILGFTHGDVGASLIEKWGLPLMLSETTRHHHFPQNAEHYAAETRLVSLANRLGYLSASSDENAIQQALSSIEDWQATGLEVENIWSACTLAFEQVEEVLGSLNL